MIELLLNADQDLSSLFTRTLTGRCINLGEQKLDEVHLYTALATCWRNGSEAASVLLRELRQLQAMSSDSKDYNERSVSQALRTLIYAATEAFDLYHQTIPKRLEDGRGKTEVQLIRTYQATVKRLRDPIALMCNRMKHNYREIVTGRIVSEATGDTTFVYRINAAQGGIQLPDREVHRKGGFASFERTLHEIVHGLLRVDFNAGELVSNLSDNGGVAIEMKGSPNLGLAYVLGALADKTPTVAHSEPAQFDGVQVLASNVVLTRVNARKVTEPTTRTMKAIVDEAALNLQLFMR